MVLFLLPLVGLVVNSLVLIASLVAGIVLYSVTKKQAISEIQKAALVIPMANESVQYSEVPMAVICVIAHHFQIPLQDVAQEYVKDAESRHALILNNFRKDSLTDHFTSTYQSKFISHGYIGEELLIQ